MRPETARGTRRLVPRRRRSRIRGDLGSDAPGANPSNGPSDPDADPSDDAEPGWRAARSSEAPGWRQEAGAGGASADAPGRSDGQEADRSPQAAEDDFDPAEFAEFLEGDDGSVAPDPAFKERLRQQLWSLVRDGAGTRRSERESQSRRAGARPRPPFPDPKRRS